MGAGKRETPGPFRSAIVLCGPGPVSGSPFISVFFIVVPVYKSPPFDSDATHVAELLELFVAELVWTKEVDLFGQPESFYRTRLVRGSDRKRVFCRCDYIYIFWRLDCDIEKACRSKVLVGCYR